MICYNVDNINRIKTEDVHPKAYAALSFNFTVNFIIFIIVSISFSAGNYLFIFLANPREPTHQTNYQQQCDGQEKSHL